VTRDKKKRKPTSKDRRGVLGPSERTERKKTEETEKVDGSVPYTALSKRHAGDGGHSEYNAGLVVPSKKKERERGVTP